MRGDDFSVVQRCLAGERDAFRDLVLRHQKSVYDTIVRMVFNRETAKDLTQEVFVKAYTKLSTFDPRFPFGVWIHRIATHHAIDHIRRRKPELLILDDDSNSGKPALLSTIQDPALRVDQKMEQDELAVTVQKALLELEPNLRAVIILRHFREMNYDEISEVLRIPLGTVKNRLFRAREKLVQILSSAGKVQEEVFS